MKRIVPILAGLMLFTGIILFLYPVVSNYLAVRQQENVIVGYEESMLTLTDDTIRREWKKAEEYNRNRENYMDTLNISGNGVMGYIEIPKIDVRIPIYHGTSEESLKKGAGHLEQTGLPIGEINNHPVLMGHRGLPNAELFTRLDEVKMGDVFIIYVMDKVFTYEVKKITIVLPEEVKNIQEEENRDLITLVTCTPYGVNTHRLLVTGERTQNQDISYEEQEVNTTGRNKIIFYIIIIFTGITFFVYPHFTNRVFQQKVDRQQKIYFHHLSTEENAMEKLYIELNNRNKELYKSRQKDFVSADAYQKPTINLRVFGIYNNTVGYLTIPKMKIQLPILLGASEENMKKGAVHLTETSYPVGGENTNCVLAAHRGYAKTAMFRDIDKLEIGDQIYVKNFREKLTYKVIQIRIISPNDTDEVLIREGKDMVTLITCHPYRKNTRRYVVFCERV